MTAELGVQQTLDGGMEITVVIVGRTPQELDAAIRAAISQLDAYRRGEAQSNQLAQATAIDHWLTPRERQVVALVLRGKSNKEIARKLGISAHTVGAHLKRVYARVNAHNRSQLALRANGGGT